ncbi:NAD+ synthase [Undibacterium sp. RTI2.1]|uniref:NAD+ synthase n=1 Tax=unclassified Undibacterium TaxID=2630295 RepID=UPI002AB46DA7|nr:MULTISPECIES: NAD+ synthase [unclassified Undibacterium]MDY7537216.1 NAD+ synthase [Undibacterium sp. 5I1]MEB0031341.1 NAD+ synthase [Undibacterium sp. RTI2.1]MEB0117710.1 NAD+ synthase [Undibacterium sp. RTI2.2]MEB0231505.1 NAD+ synthase [Undibacterium sp. 10I3]MEB0259012.1 NAD+ synthase [Undibacterium sp. 5I1]
MTVKVAIAQMNSVVGDLAGNAAQILDYAQRAAAQGADIVVTPELSLVGYPPEDLLLRSAFYAKTRETLFALAESLRVLKDMHVLIGHPAENDGVRLNAASVLCNGEVIGSYYKHDLPNDMVFDEKRYFSSGHDAFVFEVKGIKFGVNICEDTWLPTAPKIAKNAGAEVLLVPNGSPYHMSKQHQRFDVMRANVTSQGMSLVYANLVGGQDELIFDGNSFVMNQAGEVCVQLKHCEADLQIVEFDGAAPIMPIAPMLAPQEVINGASPDAQIDTQIEAQVYQALVLGVRDYVGKNGFPSIVLGLSGGVDSALVLAIAVDALGADKVRAVMMPSPYTADISWLDSREMVQGLGVRYDEIPIIACFSAFRDTLSQEFAGLAEDTTEENIQARIRGTILMALSNKYGSIVLTTGNKSEMAVGYCTLYGDMAGGFAVIKDIAKTLVYRLCAYRNRLSPVIPERILTRPPSAELRPDQTDQDSLPPYEILDGIMQRYMEENQSRADIVAAGYREEDVERITRLIKINEYKRRQAPVGIRVTHRAFGRDWRYPITSKFRD